MVTMLPAMSIYFPGSFIVLLSLSIYPLLTSQNSLLSNPDLIPSHAQQCSRKLHPVSSYE
ncbi:semaphorin-5B isoform X1, partial [Tachysurus ichikawai]